MEKIKFLADDYLIDDKGNPYAKSRPDRGQIADKVNEIIKTINDLIDKSDS